MQTNKQLESNVADLQKEVEMSKNVPKLGMTSKSGAESRNTVSRRGTTVSPEMGKSQKNLMRSDKSEYQCSLNLNLSHSIDEIQKQMDITQLIGTN